MSRKRQKRRRIGFEILENREVLDASGLVLVDAPVVGADSIILETQVESERLDAVETTSGSNRQTSSLSVIGDEVGGTLVLDAVILGGVQNDLEISVGDVQLVNTELSGTIDIGTATGDGVGITGFTVTGGLVVATDTTGLLNLTGVTAEPSDRNPGINPVAGGNFNASEVGLSINNGTAELPSLGLSFDFAITPVQGPGSGTGTVVVNSVNGREYDITVSIPVALQLEAVPGVFADVNGTIVASGIVTVAPSPAEIMTGFYNRIKESIGSDQAFGDLIVATKSAIDSGDTSLRAQVYVDAQTLTAELSADVVNAFYEIEAGLSNSQELDYLHHTVHVVISELEALRDFLSGALQSPHQFTSLTLTEFFGAAVQDVRDRVYGNG